MLTIQSGLQQKKAKGRLRLSWDNALIPGHFADKWRAATSVILNWLHYVNSECQLSGAACNMLESLLTTDNQHEIYF